MSSYNELSCRILINELDENILSTVNESLDEIHCDYDYDGADRLMCSADSFDEVIEILDELCIDYDVIVDKYGPEEEEERE